MGQRCEGEQQPQIPTNRALVGAFVILYIYFEHSEKQIVVLEVVLAQPKKFSQVEERERSRSRNNNVQAA